MANSALNLDDLPDLPDQSKASNDSGLSLDDLPDLPGSETQPKVTNVKTVPAPLAAQAAGPKPFANAPDDTLTSSLAKGSATAGIQGVADIPGTPGNIMALAHYLRIRANSLMSGNTPEEEERLYKIGETGNGKNAGVDVSEGPNFPTGEQLAKPILNLTGEYVPQSTSGRMAMTGLRTAVGTLPFGGIKTAPSAFTSGSVGQGVAEATGDPLYGLAAGIAVPAITHGVMQTGKFFANKAYPVNPQETASNLLYQAAGQPTEPLGTYKDLPEEILPGSKPSLAESTGNVGLAQAENQARANNPSFQTAQIQNAGQQNASRVDAMQNIAPENADIMNPVTHLQNSLANIDSARDMAIDQLGAQHAEALQNGVNPETVGNNLRTIVQNVHDVANEQKNALYKAVDPGNKINVVTAPARAGAQSLQAEIDPNFSIPDPTVTDVLNKVANLGDVTPFNKLTQLDATISSAMSEAQRSGNMANVRMLSKAKGLVMDSINKAVENQHTWEQNAQAAGVINPADTIEGRFKNLNANTDLNNTGRNSSANGIAGVVGTPPGSPPDLSGNSVAGSQEAGRLRGSASAQGVPGAQSEVAANPSPINYNPQNKAQALEAANRLFGGNEPSAPVSAPPSPSKPILEPNADADFAARLQQAKQAHAEIQQTYGQEPIKSVLQSSGYKGEYKLPDSGIPAKVFSAGDKGYETAQAFLDAAKNDPQAVGALQDMAISRLSGKLKSGADLDAKTLDTWKSQYGNALRAIDEVSPGFSSKFDNVANATEAMNELNKGITGNLLRATHPAEVKAQVGQLIRSSTGPTQIKTLIDGLQDNPAAIDGLRKATVDHIIDSVSNAGISGAENKVSGAKLNALIKNHGAAVEAMLGPEGMAAIKAVALDAERTDATLSAGSTRTGPGTSRDLMAKINAISENQGHLSLGDIFGLAGIEAWQAGGVKSAAAIGAMSIVRGIISKFRQAGMNKVNDLYLAGLKDPDIGRAMINSVINGKGKNGLVSLDNLANATLRAAQMNQNLQNGARIGRKSGGRVEKSHEFLVNRLIKLAELAKKSQNNMTKPLLNAPDEAVVKALKITQRGI